MAHATDHFNLIVIGAGVAGNVAATKCASAGWNVAIVDDLPYGGTCALRGCDPKKILRRGAEVIDSARLMKGKGIDAQGLSINWTDLMKHKQGFTEAMPARVERGLRRSGVETLHGTATFTGSNGLDIDGSGYTAEHFLIATGARPAPLNFPGEEHLIDSTDFLSLDELPERIVFIGGGFISFEFAHLAARCGSVVSIVIRSSRPLKGFDPDLVDQLVEHGTHIGIDTQTDAAIVSVEALRAGYRVNLERAGNQYSIEADLVVHGAGRVSDISHLAPESANIDYGPRGVSVTTSLQSTSNAAVYAAGDCADTPGMSLTPVAVIEGKVAASNMMESEAVSPDYAGVATAVFTIPELARVGMLERDAVEAGINLDVRHVNTSSWFSNYRIGESTAAVKILIDKDSDTIVGAHMFGHEYGELINFCALAIKLGLTTAQLKSMTAVYPTVTSDLGSML